MTERVVPATELDGYVGQNISQICDHGFTSEAHHTNHCAHFVSHLLGFTFAVTCGDMTNAPHKGGTIRVNEIYNRCANRGGWAVRPVVLIYTMIFATQATNMKQNGDMMTSPRKHMGIWSDPWVYNYSTMNHQVLKESVPDFQARLNGVYNPGGTDPVLLFFGRNVP